MKQTINYRSALHS